MRMPNIVFFWLFYLSVCHGYRLLGLFPFFGKSHFIMFEQLLKGLSRKGHQVDVISSFPLKRPYPNYTDIVELVPPLVLVNNLSYEYMQQLFRDSPVHAVATVAGNNVCEYLENPAIQELARNPPKDPPYDAVLIEVSKNLSIQRQVFHWIHTDFSYYIYS